MMSSIHNLEPTADRIREAVFAYNQVYGEMDAAMWKLAELTRPVLTQGTESRLPQLLVWTVKSWWGVQGVRRETSEHMARALTELAKAGALRLALPRTAGVASRNATGLVGSLVAGTRAGGTFRREWSLASKVLHWLLPSQIPVFDDFVRRAVMVPVGRDPADTYQSVAGRVFQIRNQVAGDSSSWVGTVPPAADLRAIDKFLWWSAGGSAKKAVLVKDPGRALDKKTAYFGDVPFGTF